ncbi:hypothetical protein Bcav_2530 [Beutenbergia cavernae DSM 12333]|uniref:Uncharacterized protein n=1 Tax=Beutenbergia cavernae (strain ATCC BAA-8 / DSM 12333 / CCUG 43141 / JCM 11478 / NBRC 16432 / NCIMB 13614 / HKI 0122) TaxID=471853 RepID=C5BWW2_BEUC1|nr:hypothetical protein [Beutenbergia cavernae]ACQ80778.1 hypothetical protein Bcav_2530 [Beutenbergia cavernae DSM 12333]
MDWIGIVVAGILGVSGVWATVYVNDRNAQRAERERTRDADRVDAAGIREQKVADYRALLDAFTKWAALQDGKGKTVVYETDVDASTVALLTACARAKLVASTPVRQAIGSVEALTGRRSPGDAARSPSGVTTVDIVFDALTAAMNADVAT